MRKIILITFLCAIIFSACDDGGGTIEPDNGNFTGLKFNTAGSISLAISHKFNNDTLTLGKNYVTSQNDTVSFSKFKYYISNISLQSSSGNWVNLGNYSLLDLEVPARHTITLNNVPAGNYVKMSLLLGIDSLSNFSGAQTGDLDPSYGMYWTWATGYVFFRLSGRYNGNKALTFDLGGDKNLPRVEFDLSGYKLQGNKFNVNTTFNLASIFDSPHDYKLSSTNDDMHTATYPGASLLRDNIQMGCFNVLDIK